MDKCKKCGGDNKTVNLPRNRKFKEGQKYYFTRYYKCLECGFHCNSNEHKEYIDQKT